MYNLVSPFGSIRHGKAIATTLRLDTHKVNEAIRKNLLTY